MFIFLSIEFNFVIFFFSFILFLSFFLGIGAGIRDGVGAGVEETRASVGGTGASVRRTGAGIGHREQVLGICARLWYLVSCTEANPTDPWG